MPLNYFQYPWRQGEIQELTSKSYRNEGQRFIAPLIPFVGGLLVGGLFAPKGNAPCPPGYPCYPPPPYQSYPPPYQQQNFYGPPPYQQTPPPYQSQIPPTPYNDGVNQYYVYNPNETNSVYYFSQGDQPN